MQSKSEGEAKHKGNISAKAAESRRRKPCKYCGKVVGKKHSVYACNAAASKRDEAAASLLTLATVCNSSSTKV